ncbi:hypothetical protein llg_12570 [Luteolibacter sp. LG18]|nr:hypothetical protein llg_12570 [Luteolibacter sp. LG18]
MDTSHDRREFSSGLETVDRYLKETARGHTEKGVAITRVLVDHQAVAPKKILGYFTLTPCMATAASWEGSPKGLPKSPVGMVLLGRLAVDSTTQGQGLGGTLLALARQIAHDSLAATGGIGMVVDAAGEEIVAFYTHHGFRRTAPDSLRLFLPTAALV